MKTKQHQSPEFTVIKQSQANAKFFVASGEGGGGGGFTSSAPTGGGNYSATQYGDGGSIGM